MSTMGYGGSSEPMAVIRNLMATEGASACGRSEPKAVEVSMSPKISEADPRESS